MPETSRGHPLAAIRYALLCLILLWIPHSAAQQVLDFSSGALPICAQQCGVLYQAQYGCVPPQAAVTSQQTYVSCLCQSAFLPNIKSDATAACGAYCQGADLTSISQWFSRTCGAGTNAAAAPAPAPGAATTTTANAAATTTAGSGTTTNTAGSSAGSTSPARTGQQHQGWWAGHWRWVVMIIVLFLLLILIAVAAVLFRRHRRKKRDAIDGPFNNGITDRSMTANPVAPSAYPQPVTGAERQTPSALGSIRRGDSRIASTSTLPKAARLSGLYDGGSGEDVRHSRTINPDTGTFDSHNGKGKGMATVREGDLRT